MSLYGIKVKINGIPCGLITRGTKNGEYHLVFEREFASLEQLEAIDWQRPKLSKSCELPAGYGFDMTNIEYRMSDKTWDVTLKVREQYLGDVAGYQAQVAGLEADKAQLEADKTKLEADVASYQARVNKLEVYNAQQEADIAAKNTAIGELRDQLAEADETAIALYEDLQAARRLGYDTEETEAGQTEISEGEEAQA